jgi:hypothetical protein
MDSRNRQQSTLFRVFRWTSVARVGRIVHLEESDPQGDLGRSTMSLPFYLQFGPGRIVAGAAPLLVREQDFRHYGRRKGPIMDNWPNRHYPGCPVIAIAERELVPCP